MFAKDEKSNPGFYPFLLQKGWLIPLTLVMAAGIMWGRFTADDVKSAEDLATLGGRLTEYAFFYKPDSTKEYYFRLSAYPGGTLRIQPDHKALFDEKSFSTDIQKGDSVKVKIAKKRIGELHKRKEVWVYEISGTEKNYLSYAQISKLPPQTEVAPLMAAVCVAVSVLSALGLYRKWKQMQIENQRHY